MPVTFTRSELAPIAERIVRAEREFDEHLMARSGIDAETAARVRVFYAKNKITKLDAGIGRITVKHGAFLGRDVILRAAAEA